MCWPTLTDTNLDSNFLQDDITPILAYFASSSAHLAAAPGWPTAAGNQIGFVNVTDIEAVTGQGVVGGKKG